VGFEVDYMTGTFRGSFGDVDAKLVIGNETVELEGAAKVDSVQVKDESLAGHLTSPDFFDAERNPEIRFSATRLVRSGDEVKGEGELEIKGTPRKVPFSGRISDPIEDAHGNTRLGLKLETSVDRTEYGLEWNLELPSGEPALANDVRIVVDLQLVREA
jgi:polyisoprenoid-binding protein YceI